MKKITLLIFIFINFMMFSQPSIEELNKLEIKHISNKNTLTSREMREINELSKELRFDIDASNNKVFWSTGRPKKGTGFGKYYQRIYTYVCNWEKYKMNGKLTIKFKDTDLVVFEGTAKDDIIQQGVVYSYINYPNYGLYQIPKYYGKFMPYTWEKDDIWINYHVNGTKFILDEDKTKVPYFIKAEYGYQLYDMFQKSFYKGLSYYYVNKASINKPTDWRLLYQFSKNRNNKYSGVWIDYEQLHNFDTRNTEFYNKTPKYYLKYVYHKIKNTVEEDKFEVFDANTNQPIDFNPNHIISEFIDKYKRKFYVYYDDEDWEKRIAFIEAKKAEKTNFKRSEEEIVQHSIDKLKKEDDIYNASQETLTYTKNGNTHVEKKFNEEIPWAEINTPLRIYDTESNMNHQKNEKRYDMVKFEATKDAKGQWLTGDVLDGYFKGKFYYTNDSITSVKGKFHTSKFINKATIIRENLFYIGIVCSHNLFPTKSWSSILKSNERYAYGLFNRYELATDGSLTFNYKAEDGKQIMVTVYPNEIGETNTIFRVKIEVNKKTLLQSLSETFKMINESQIKLNESLKEYNEKMKEINENLKLQNEN